MIDLSPRCIWPLGARLGEGPLWHAIERAVYFVDIQGRRIHRLSVEDGRCDSWVAPGEPGFIVPFDDHRFVCGLADGLHVFEPAKPVGTQFTPLVKVEPELTGNRLNDGHVDARGRLWFGSMDNGESQPTGTLYTLGSDGAPVAQDRGYVITNGPATSPDGRTLYHTDTLGRIVYAFDVSDDGGLARKREFLRFGGEGHAGGYPDGMAVDSQGCLWVAFFGGWRIDRFSPQGELLGSVRFPCAHITKLAFGGDDLRTVYVTTATKGLSPDELLRQPMAGGLFSFSLTHRRPAPAPLPHRNRRMTQPNGTTRRFRSQDWFANPDHIDLTALYLERFMNYGITPAELRSGRPIIGIAQSGSDLNPCNRVHLELAKRVRDGIRDAGGIPIEFPVHPTFENCRRPTAAIDRNLAYMALVEILHGYPIDAVVLTTGCDKSTPSQVMAAATMDLPAIVLSGGPMLDGWFEGELVGSGMAIWKSRRLLAAGKIDEARFMDIATASAPSVGHCNTMGTASTMNALAEALGLSLTGCAAIPAPYRERGQMAYETGLRIVQMAYEDIRPSSILTRDAFLDAIVVNSAIGGSTNAQPHLMAMARHAGVELHPSDWTEFGLDVPLLLNMQPAGKYLGEAFHRAGGVPAVMWELQQAGLLRSARPTVTGKTMLQNLEGRESPNRDVIRSFGQPLKTRAGFLVLKGNLFDFAIMKTSVISPEFRARYLSEPGAEGRFECRAIVFEDSDDYHARINDPALAIDEHCILVIRGAGPVGWPGSAEVVNMQPPDALLKRGITSLPTLGDGRQSGTSDSPSILNASPESAVGGGLAHLRTGDIVRIDLNAGACDMLVPAEEIARRKGEGPLPIRPSQTPWQEMYRATVGQLETGACMETALKYRGVAHTLPRHNH